MAQKKTNKKKSSVSSRQIAAILVAITTLLIIIAAAISRASNPGLSTVNLSQGTVTSSVNPSATGDPSSPTSSLSPTPSPVNSQTTTPKPSTSKSPASGATPSTNSATSPSPTVTPFSVNGTAIKATERIYACQNERFSFVATLKATKAGTAQWNWIRWDGGTSGATGSVTFDDNGDPVVGPSLYNLTISPGYDISGWMSLQVTWDGGSFTTNRASFNYNAAAVFGSCP